jgi:preprotein translocase subunit YajC
MAPAVFLASTADTSSGGGIAQIAIFAVFGVALYFLLIRPQQKRQKQQQSLIEKLEPGLDVVTVGGLHGTIDDVSDAWVDLTVDQDGTVLRFQRQAIASITRPGDEDENEDE